jgi:DNA-binding NtrC family response regulator
MKFHLLIAEDDRDAAALLRELAQEQDFHAEIAADGDVAAERLRAEEWDVLLTDLRLPGQDGLQLVDLARRQDPPVASVLITGFATARDAIQAFRAGVADIVLKPFEPEQVRHVLRRLGDALRQRQRMRQLSAELARERGDAQPLAASPAMIRAMDLAAQVAGTDLPVLLQGETGTGKGMLAAHIHRISPRAEGPFLTLNCGALAPTLLDSELFGHEKGAFTGAASRRVGLLELAHGGTLFLDEINSASAELQVRLLQFIQEGRFLRVGGNRPIEVEVRLVLASNQDLKLLADRGGFRSDLYYRINVFPIPLPALRDRPEDIPELAAFLLAKHGRRLGKNIAGIGPEVIEQLRRYAWPGNVRELENLIQRAIVLCAGELLGLGDFPAEVAGRLAAPPGGLPWSEDASLAEVERHWIARVLERCQGSRSRAAAILGIDPATLWRKLKS